jgi:hypothetical protein
MGFGATIGPEAGLAAFDTIPAAGIAQLFFFIGLLELGFSTKKEEIEKICISEAKKRGWDDKKINNKKAIELNNGRAAQMGIFAMVVHEKLDGNPYVLNGGKLNLTSLSLLG